MNLTNTTFRILILIQTYKIRLKCILFINSFFYHLSHLYNDMYYLIDFIFFMSFISKLLINKLLYCSVRLIAFINFRFKCALFHLFLFKLLFKKGYFIILIKIASPILKKLWLIFYIICK